MAMRPQLHKALDNDFFQQFFPAGLQRNQHLAPVFPPPRAFNKTVRFHTVNQFDCAVMTEGQAFCDRADAGLLSGLEPANRQQQKVLLRFKPCLARGLVAFLQEASYQVTKL